MFKKFFYILYVAPPKKTSAYQTPLLQEGLIRIASL